MMPLIADS